MDIEKKREEYMFLPKLEIEEKESNSPVDQLNKYYYYTLRTLGVIIYDLLTAEVAINVFNTYNSTDKNNLTFLFEKFKDYRSDILCNHIKDFIKKENETIKICLLQEVSKKYISELGDQNIKYVERGINATSLVLEYNEEQIKSLNNNLEISDDAVSILDKIEELLNTFITTYKDISDDDRQEKGGFIEMKGNIIQEIKSYNSIVIYNSFYNHDKAASINVSLDSIKDTEITISERLNLTVIHKLNEMTKNTSYEFEYGFYKLSDDKYILFCSFHGDTTGGKTIGFLKEIYKIYFCTHIISDIIIGIDSNLKKQKQFLELIKLMKTEQSEYLNVDTSNINDLENCNVEASFNIAGFEFLKDYLKEDNEQNERCNNLYNKLINIPTNGGIRSACQSQWTKIHDKDSFYIDFILYQSKSPEHKLKNVTICEDIPTKIDNNDIEKLLDTVNKKSSLFKVSGAYNNEVESWGKILTNNNPSDHLPRCTTFKIKLEDGNEKIFEVLSWNIAGPNFNWAEYYPPDVDQEELRKK